MAGIDYGSTAIKHIYYGSTAIKSVYYGSTKVRPNGQMYYIFTDGIYTGTDTAPKTTQILSATICTFLYDRDNDILWLMTTSGIGTFNFSTNTISYITSISISNGVFNEFNLKKDYIVASPTSNYGTLYIYNRADASLNHSITYLTANYSTYEQGINYNLDNYIYYNGGYKQTYAYNIDTKASTSIYNTSYHQVNYFNGYYYVTCENGSYNAYIYNTSGTYVATPFSGRNFNACGIWQTADSDTITSISSSDWEYTRLAVCGTRGSTTTYIVNGTSASSSSSNMKGAFVRYNDIYSLVFSDNNSVHGLVRYNRTDNTLTTLFTNSRTTGALCKMISFSDDGNIGSSLYGIVDIDGNTIYSSTAFLGMVNI